MEQIGNEVVFVEFLVHVFFISFAFNIFVVSYWVYTFFESKLFQNSQGAKLHKKKLNH